MNTARAARVDRSLAATCSSSKPQVVSSVSDRLGEAATRSLPREVELFYRQACHGLFLSELDGDAHQNSEEFLAEATFRCARNALDAQTSLVAGAGEPSALAAVADDLRARFSQAELLPETLRVIYRRPDAESLFVDRVEAELNIADDGALAGRPCADRALLVGRFTLGALTPDSDEIRDAAAHLRGCENCRRHAKRVWVLAAACEPSSELLAAATDRTATRRKGSALLASRGGSRPAGRIVLGAAVAAALLVGAFIVFGTAGDQSPPNVAAASTAAQLATTSELRAAESERKSKVARERRAERIRAKRAAAKRRAAKRRAAKRRAAKRRAAERAAALARARQTTTQSAPQTQAPSQTSTPKSTPKKQPKPSTDPSQEFGT